MGDKVKQLEEIVAIANILPICMHWKDLSGKYLGCNEIYAQIWHLTPKDIIGKTIFDLLPKHAANKAFDNDYKAIKQNSIYLAEEAIEQDGKNNIYLTQRKPLYGKDSNIIGLIVCSVDITDLQREKSNIANYFAHVLAIVPSHIFWMDAEGRMLGCNEQQARTLGLTVNELIGRNIFDVADILNWPADIPQQIRQHDLEIMATNKTKLFEEKVILNNQEKYYLTHKGPLYDVAGSIKGVVGISTDITEQKQIAVALQHAKEKAETLSQAALQAAHDICSPLAALEMIISSLRKELPEDDRILIRSAVNRIRDIAHDLLAKNHLLEPNIKIASDAKSELSLELLSSLLIPLLTEKRLQFRNRAEIGIEGKLNAFSYGLFAKVDAIELQRLLSNLINNAIEAIIGPGSITINLQGLDDMIAINIIDTGKGIPEEVLRKLETQAFSYDKENGHGLGLSHARKTLESWGGYLKITSELGKGTTVTISIPQSLPPNWFLPSLDLESNQTIVIIDDDPSIHQIWHNRFNQLQVAVINCYSGQELQDWVKANSIKAQDALFLSDYELVGSKESGLELLRTLPQTSTKILVTSHFNKIHIRKRCEELGVKLIPKDLAGFIPIDYNKEEAPMIDAIFIDDDETLRDAWQLTAALHDKTLHCFASIQEFLEKQDDFSRQTPIYIDSNLGNETKGEEAAKEIFELGFTNIYLATGYPSWHFKSMPWLKGIVGKMPPWEVEAYAIE